MATDSRTDGLDGLKPRIDGYPRRSSVGCIVVVCHSVVSVIRHLSFVIRHSYTAMTYKMGVVGLGVMGASLARNIESKGFPVAGYDLDAAKMKAFLEGPAKGKAIIGVDRPERADGRARAAAAHPDDGAGGQGRRQRHRTSPAPSAGGRHPHRRRQLALHRHRPPQRRARRRRASASSARASRAARRARCSVRASCRADRAKRWDALAPIFRAIAAKADDGEPCVDYMGPRGAGHYVKMVHNGIEYGDMQLIAETYDLLHRGAGLSRHGAGGGLRRVEPRASCART